jgi:DNA invertase Pin-like site-specific DNA recombinase
MKGLALLYCRVSTNRQELTGHSLDSQTALLKANAESKGYQVEVITETGSGRKANRPELNKAIARLNKGEAQALFVIDLDRLARSVRHLTEIMDQARKHTWRLVIATADVDTKTPSGEMIAGSLAVFAQFESRMIGERVKRQHQARRDRGIVWGVDQGFKGNLPMATRALVAALNAEGKSLRAIAAELTAKGLKTPRGGEWHPATIAAILKSPQTASLKGAN